MFRVIMNQRQSELHLVSGQKPDFKKMHANKSLWNNNHDNNNYVVISRKELLQDTCHTTQSFHFQRGIIRIDLPIVIIMHLQMSHPLP